MKILILDFLRRWWWLIALCALFPIALGAGGFPFVFAPPALICLIMDAQRGVFRAARVLPIRSRAQAAAWWFIGVPLLPLLSIPALAIGAHLFQVIHPPVPIPSPVEIGAVGAQVAQVVPFFESGLSPWFVTLVQSWVALGYAGLCFLLVLGLPTRPAEGALESVAQGLVGGLWGMSIPALMFILPNMPKSPAHIAPWHWLVFAAAPVCVLLSFLTAPDVMQRRTVVVAAKPRPQTASGPVVHESGLTGLPFFVVKFLFGFGIVLAGIAVGQMLFFRWMFGVPPTSANPALAAQFVTIAIAFGAITGEVAGLRLLRTLPLSTMQLALLLSSGPWLAGLGTASFTALWQGMGNPAWPPLGNFVAQTLAFGGWGTLVLAIVLHIVSEARLLLLMMLAMVPAALFAVLSPHSASLALGGGITGVLGFALLHRGLRKSSTYYQPRRIFGIVGGPAMAVR